MAECQVPPFGARLGNSKSDKWRPGGVGLSTDLLDEATRHQIKYPGGQCSFGNCGYLCIGKLAVHGARLLGKTVLQPAVEQKCASSVPCMESSERGAL